MKLLLSETENLVHILLYCFQKICNPDDSVKTTTLMEKEGNLIFHPDPKVHQIKGQFQLANRCFMVFKVFKEKWLVMDNSEMLPRKVDGSLKSFRSQPLQKTLMPNMLVLGPGNVGLPSIKIIINKQANRTFGSILFCSHR